MNLDRAAYTRLRRGRVTLSVVVLVLGVAVTGAALLVLFRRVAPSPALPPPPRFGQGIAPDASGRKPNDATVTRSQVAGAEERPKPLGADWLEPDETPIVDRSRIEGGLNRPPRPRQDTDEQAAKAVRARDARQQLDRSAEARRRRVRRFGGNARTESAVEAGLAWLAVHQSADGSWDRIDFVRLCPQRDRCRGPAITRTEHSLQAGITGLATLAFLGAGYTPSSGPYQRTVEDGVRALVHMQQPHGGFSQAESMAGYNDSLATLALAECYAMTGDKRLVQPLRLAVLRLTNSQQKLGGWDYLPTPNSARNDTSITAWVVQALQACSAAGITVPPKALIGAALHFASASQSDGRVWYSDSGRGFELDQKTMRPAFRYGPAMSACGMMAESILGWRLDTPLLRTQRALIFEQLPSQALAMGQDRTHLHSQYYWYYGTVAAFQLGGNYWDRWNAHLRDAILPLQNRKKTAKGQKRHEYGSWPPYGLERGQKWGKWGRMGGRVYSTAISTLTLEIYYRHTPAYLDDHFVLSADDWRGYLRGADPLRRKSAVGVLADLRYEVGEPVLIDLLDDAEQGVALAAAAALATIDS
ncbi:MAG: hypothetical protein IID33_02200, partial [Planctomycetes bacterium]|nr:hypothetical protein [Planctomycetota bacterium]